MGGDLGFDDNEADQVDIDKNQQEEDANYFDEDDLGESHHGGDGDVTI